MSFYDIYINGYFISGEMPMQYYYLGLLVIVVISYLLGSLNSAIIISKLKHHEDIRKHGSGNAGMTNMLRTYGKLDGVLTLLGDMLKVVVAVFIARLLCGEEGAYLAGTFCVIGHIAPAYYGFKGGKGVVAAATTILIIDPQIFLILIVLFVIIVAISRYISLGSIICGIAYPGIVYWRIMNATGGHEPPKPLMLLFPIFIGLLLIFTHRENIKRLMNNKENKFSFKKKDVDMGKYIEPKDSLKYNDKK